MSVLRYKKIPSPVNKGGKIRYQCRKTYLPDVNSVVALRNTIFNVKELKPVLSIVLIKR